MKNLYLVSVLSILLGTIVQAAPFGKVGQWNAGGSHGQLEYVAVQATDTYWLISCDNYEYKDPYFSLVINGKEIKTYDIVVDNVTYSKPYWKPAARNDGTLYNMWWALRKGKNISAKVNGKLYPLPSKNSAKALPSELDTQNFCIPSY